jgi:hypothetical protein
MFKFKSIVNNFDLIDFKGVPKFGENHKWQVEEVGKKSFKSSSSSGLLLFRVLDPVILQFWRDKFLVTVLHELKLKECC